MDHKHQLNHDMHLIVNVNNVLVREDQINKVEEQDQERMQNIIQRIILCTKSREEQLLLINHYPLRQSESDHLRVGSSKNSFEPKFDELSDRILSHTMGGIDIEYPFLLSIHLEG